MIKLLKGDCLIESDKIESGSVDFILTDLPYGIMNTDGGRKLGINGWDIAIDPKKVYEIANRILRKNGKMILFSQEPYTTKLITGAIPNIPFGYRATWEKDNFANALGVNKNMVSFTEDVLVFSKGSHGTYGTDDSYREYLNIERKKAKLTLDEMCGICGLNTKGHGGAAYHWCRSLQPSMIPEKHYLKLREVTGFFNREYKELKEIHFNCFKRFASTFNLWEGNKYKSNILKYKKDYDGHHPTQKPVLLLEDLIKTFSNEGDNVVDLTMGSGSTGVACVNTNRNFIGIEMDDNYFEVATKRINKL